MFITSVQTSFLYYNVTTIYTHVSFPRIFNLLYNYLNSNYIYTKFIFENVSSLFVGYCYVLERDPRYLGVYTVAPRRWQSVQHHDLPPDVADHSLDFQWIPALAVEEPSPNSTGQDFVVEETLVVPKHTRMKLLPQQYQIVNLDFSVDWL